MKIYVKTDYVPENGLGYLTPNKLYEYNDNMIENDNGRKSFIHLESSAHLDYRPWKVIVRVPHNNSILKEGENHD